MAIRIRRGLYDDFDSTKMLPGEWAVAIDSDTSKQVVWMCFAPGVVKRMGTYEDFKQQIEEATAEIKDEYLTEFQAILDQIDKLAETTQSNTDTVIQIRDTTVDTYLPQMLKYLENAQAASKTATEQATSASTSATNAKTSETLAKSYMERAFSATPEGYDALVDNVANLDIQTTTDSTLYGSKSGGLRVKHMIGKSVQRQLSGKNLYNVNDISSSSNSTVNNEGWITATIDNTSGTSYAYAGWLTNLQNFLKVSTQYAVVVEIKEISNGNLTVNREVTNEISQFETIVEISKAGTFVELMSTKNSFDDSTYCLRTYFRVGAGMSGKVIYRISVLEDTTVTAETFEYEPYCGGTPSPNPEYRQSIHHTGDCVEMIQGRWNGETGAYTTSTTSICTKISIPCKSGDKVKVVLEKPSTLQCVYSTDSGHLSYKGVETVSEYEFTVPSNATKFKFNVINADGITPQTVGKIQLTINGKYVVQIVEHGKNCLMITAKSSTTLGVDFSVDKDKGTIACKGTSTGGNFEVARIDCKKYYGKKICLSGCPSMGSGNTYYCEFVIVHNDGTPNRWGIRDYGNSSVITINENMAEIVYFIGFGNGYTANNLTFKPQLEIGDTFTGFEPYTEKVATILLDEPLREGDRLVKVDGVWNVERHSAEVVFDGSSDETWVFESNDYNSSMYTKISDMIVGTGGYDENIICDKLIQISSAASTYPYRVNNFCRFIGSNAFQIYLPIGTFTDSNSGKAWLQSNPLKVQYKLATPTYEVLDTASQIALNSLKTFNTVTHIAVDSVTQPAELEVEFGKSKVGAYTLKSLNDNDIDRIERAEMKAQLNELATALVAVGSEV